MNEEIKTMLGNSITVSDVDVPVAHIRYKGTSKTFITWVIASDTPYLNANDDELYGVEQVDVHVFSDSNYLNIMRKIKQLFKENEWLWVEDSIEMYEEDTELYHRVMTFEKERMI